MIFNTPLDRIFAKIINEKLKRFFILSFLFDKFVITKE